jgi:hypothetical protein
VIVNIRIGERIKVLVQGQPAPLWVEVIDLDADGFPHVVKECTGQRRRFSRSRVEFSVLVFQSKAGAA